MTSILQNALNEYFDNPAQKGALDKLYASALSCGQEDHEIIQHIFIRHNIKDTLSSKGVDWARKELSLSSSGLKKETVSTLSDAKILEVAEDVFSANSCKIISQTIDHPKVASSPVSSAHQRYARNSYQIQLTSPIFQKIQKISIAGDGHCMFRSYAFSLLQQLSAHPRAKQAVVDRLEFYKATMPPQIMTEFPDVKEQLSFVISTILDPRDAYLKVNDEAISDKLVKAFRVLACAWNSIKPTFQATITDERERALYFRNMQDMSQRKYGGHEEFTALADAFGITVLSLNFTSREVAIARPVANALDSDNVFVTLHFNPGHYDALVMDDIHASAIFAASDGADSTKFQVG
jgi:Peptidase C65 Otubain